MSKPERFWDSWWFIIALILGLMIVPVLVFVGIMFFWMSGGSSTSPGPYG